MDSPGFEDSAGCEVEASNKIATIEALRKAKKLHVLVMLSQTIFGAKGEGIKVLAETVSSIMQDYSECRSGISFVFNNFDEQFLEEFNNKIENLHKNVKTESKEYLGENYHGFFEHLKASSKVRRKMLVVNPLSLNPK